MTQVANTGGVGDVVVGKGGTVDVYLDDGCRQRLDLKEIPAGARDVLGQRLVDTRGGTVGRVVALP